VPGGGRVSLRRVGRECSGGRRFGGGLGRRLGGGGFLSFLFGAGGGGGRLIGFRGGGRAGACATRYVYEASALPKAFSGIGRATPSSMDWRHGHEEASSMTAMSPSLSRGDGRPHGAHKARYRARSFAEPIVPANAASCVDDRV